MTPTVYHIDFPDGQFYVGATVNFSERRRTRLRHGRKQRAVNPRLQAAFDIHKICCIYPIASGLSRDDLHLVETAVIAQETPPLNINTRPTRIPGRYSGATKPWGPHKCLRDAAKALGVTYTAAKKAAQRTSYEGYAVYVAGRAPKRPILFGPPDPRKNSRLVFVAAGWHRRVDVRKVSQSTYECRRKAGGSVEDALSVPLGHWRRKSAAAVCARYGVDPNTYYARRALGWTLHEALGLKPRTVKGKPTVKKRLITAGGLSMPLDAWAKRLGVKPSTIHGRLALGWSEEEAVGVKKRAVVLEREARAAKQAERKRLRAVYTYQGHTGTLSEICKALGASYPLASNRRYRGLPIEQWFEPVKPPMERRVKPLPPMPDLSGLLAA